MNFYPHLRLNNPKRESTRRIRLPCKLRPLSLCLSPLIVSLPFLFLPLSLSFPLTNQGRIFNCMSSIYNLPPTPSIAAASRSNHWSRRPKAQARYHFSRSCHRHYPSLPLKLSLSTPLTINVPSEEGKFFFVLIFVSFCVYILRFSIIIFVLDLGKMWETW